MISKDKQKILNEVNDLVSSFLYYDRKESEYLPVGVIEDTINKNELTVAEIVDVFEDTLRARLGK